MSIFSKFAHVLGFETSDDFLDEVIENDNSASTVEASEAPAPEGTTELTTLPVIDPEMKSRIFDGVIAVFNSALPDFLARSVDPAAQRRILLEALDKSADDYLSSLMLEAERYAENKLKVAVDASHREAERLKGEMQQLEQQRSSLRESQLSADRRRRALADRVADLEQRLASAEADREQFQLENKSLINKLKVADIQPGIVDEMTKEIEALRAAAKEGGTIVADPAVAEALEAKTHEAETLAQTVADLKEQQERSMVMYNDLQDKLSAERETRNAIEKQLEEANKMLDEFAQMQSQLEQIEDLINKRDQRIEKLKSSNKALKEELENLKNKHVNPAQDAIRFDEPGTPVEPETANEMAALEDDFETPDWFVADAGPGPTPLHTDDPEFGYREPAPKPKRPESDAQLSLF